MNKKLKHNINKHIFIFSSKYFNNNFSFIIIECHNLNFILFKRKKNFIMKFLSVSLIISTILFINKVILNKFHFRLNKHYNFKSLKRSIASH